MTYDKFFKIGITLADFYDGESDRIIKLLESNTVDYIHLRKPDSDVSRFANLISSIPDLYHHRLVIHDHFALVNEFHIGGLHLNSRNSGIPRGFIGRISKSLHNISELVDINLCQSKLYDYVTLSPVYDSISKPGYKSRFTVNADKNSGTQWAETMTTTLSNSNTPVVALGGVTLEKIPELMIAGFAGAAMSGALFEL